MALSPGWTHPTRLRVLDDYGEVGEGVSHARHILAENHEEYIVKGPQFSPGESYVAVNELLAAIIAKQLGLPVLDYGLVEMGGQTAFASHWMQTGSFDPGIIEATFLQCENRDRVYDLVVFDTFICNQDRHAQNLMVRRRRAASQPDRLALVLNDHSRALMPPGVSPSTISVWLGTSPDLFVQLDFIRAAVTQVEALRAAIDAVERLSDEEVRSFVRIIPDDVLALAERSHLERFLLNRRAELRQVFRSATVFPAVPGATI
jgi:hypothetical protein